MTNITKHTPEEWKIKLTNEDGDILITDVQDVTIARVYCQPLDPELTCPLY
jgi:hypothetical protein